MLLLVALAGCRSTTSDEVAVEVGTAPISAPSLERRVIPDGAGLAALAVPPGPILASRGTGQFIGRGLPSRKQPEEPGEGITLNLVNVPIAQATKTVLGDMLAVSYSVSPKVDGTLTLQTSQPIRKSEAIALFQSALASSGAAIVQNGSSYEVVPADQARTTTRMAVDKPEIVGTIGNGLQVVQLKYVAASEMKRVLEPIAPAGGVVRTDDARGVITLGGTQAQIATMLDAISIFDVDTLKGMSFALVPVESSQPDAIANDLQTVFGADKEGPMSGMVRFLPNKRLHAILVISSRPTYLSRAEAWVRKLDGQAQGTEKQIYTYTVRNRPAKELVDVVQAMFGKDGVPAPGHRSEAAKSADGSSRSVDAAAQAAPTQTFAAASPYGVITGVGTSTSNGLNANGQTSIEKNPEPEYISARVGADPSGETSRVKIVADDPNNSLVIEASPHDYRRIRQIIENLDTVPNQVLIEVTIAEVTLNDQLQFGLRWYLSGKQNSYAFSDAATTTGGAALNSVFPGFSYALAASNAQVTLNALSAITKVNVVSSPSLMVVDNKRARLEVGDQVPTLTQTAVGVVSAGAPVVESIAYVPTGVILNITPRINESGRISLDIEQEVSSAINTDSSNIDTPTIRQRRVHTTVLVNDGEALAVGGLIQDTKNVTKLQVPVLGDIPVVGTLFKNRIDTIGKTELVIMITPRVVRDSNEAAAITEEYRHKIELNLPRSHPAQHMRSTLNRIVD